VVAEGSVQAPIPAQMAGIHAALLCALGFLVLAVGFSVWALVQVTKTKKQEQTELTPEAE
jgi:hypothetical protein